MSAFGFAGFGSQNRQRQLRARGQMDQYGNNVRQAMQAPDMSAYSGGTPQATAVSNINGARPQNRQAAVRQPYSQHQPVYSAQTPSQSAAPVSPGSAQPIQPPSQGTPYVTPDDGFAQYAANITGIAADRIGAAMSRSPGAPMTDDARQLKRLQDQWTQWQPDQRSFALSQSTGSAPAAGKIRQAQDSQRNTAEIERRAYATANQAEQDGLLYQAAQMRGNAPSSYEEFLSQRNAERAAASQRMEAQRQSDAAVASQLEQARAQFQRPSGMSDAAFDYLVRQETANAPVWEAPTFAVWSELLGRPGVSYAQDAGNYLAGYGPGSQAMLEAEQNIYNQDVRYASNATVRHGPGWAQANPFQQLNWTPFKGRLTRAST